MNFCTLWIFLIEEINKISTDKLQHWFIVVNFTMVESLKMAFLYTYYFVYLYYIKPSLMFACFGACSVELTKALKFSERYCMVNYSILQILLSGALTR